MGIDRLIDITADQRKTILALLEKYLPSTAAWAYGSRISRTSRPQSDLDMVVFATPEQNDQVADLREAFEESDLPFRVDLFVWDAVPEEFRKRIEAEHAVLVEAEGGRGDWETTTWGDIASLEYGKALRNYKSSTGPYRVFGTNGPIGWHDKMLCTHPSVIIGRKGAYRGVHYSSKPFFVIDTAFYLKPKVKMDIRWAYYQLLNQDINGLDSGSAIPSTRREDFYNLLVKFPPLSEQRAIAHILGTLDDKIELNRRTNETLEEMARALFKYWFVDFGPVRAKMKGRWRRGESLPGLPAELYDLFPDRLVDSELGEAPEGWEVKALDEIAEFLNGLALQKFPASNPQDSLPVIKIAELRSGVTPKSNHASYDVPVKYLVNDGDFLFSWSGSLIAKFWTEGKGALNQHLFKVTSNQYPTWFFSHWIQYYLEEFRTIAASKATTMGHIQRKHLSGAMTNCPDNDTLSILGQVLGPLVEQSIENAIQNRILTTLRDSILPKLISGEIVTTM